MMSSKSDQDVVFRKSRRRRTIHLPAMDPECHISFRSIDLPACDGYNHSWAYLSHYWGWIALKQKLQPVAELYVKDALDQHFVDNVRNRLDSVLICDSDRPRGIPFLMRVIKWDRPGDVEILRMLLASGADPDLPDSELRRLSHCCVRLGRVDLAELIFACRPSMTAKCDGGYTPLEWACHTFESDDDHPQRKILREDVKRYIEDGGFETRFPTLAELAVRKMWFAVKNLLRRQAVEDYEFKQKVGGKNAAEWAEFYKEVGMAKEIRYYGTSLAARFEETAKQMTAMAEKLCDKEDEVFILTAKMSELEKQLDQLREGSAGKDVLVPLEAHVQPKEELDDTVDDPAFKGGDEKCDRSSPDEGCDVDSVQVSSSLDS